MSKDARQTAPEATPPSCWPFDQIRPFMDYLNVECGLARNTLMAYRRDLQRFGGYCQEEGIAAPKQLTPLGLQEYARHLSDAKLGSASVARHMASLRMFMRFHLLTGLIDKDITAVVESPKTWRRLPTVLTGGRTQELLNGPDPASPLYLRDRALMALLYATGLRASEAANLRVKDINYQVGYLTCIGKGNKERIVPIHERALEAMREYIEQLRGELVGEKNCAALFVSRTGQPLDRTEVWRIVRRAARRAGLVGKVSPHTLRHCFGSHLLQGGADLRSVQEMLGHADVATTQIYTHVDHQHLRAVHKKYHPRA